MTQMRAADMAQTDNDQARHDQDLADSDSGLHVLNGECVVLVAGGTGGHLFPAQALAEALTRQGARIALITDQRGRTYTDAFPEADLHMVDAATVAGRGSLGKLAAFGSIAKGVAQAHGLLGRIKPAAVVGFGGYPSLPAMSAALLRGIPTCIHEQNSVLGRVNRLLAGRVSAVACGFDTLIGLKNRSHLTVTGNPVRERITAVRAQPYEPVEPGGPIHVLVFGGSQGARIMGKVVPAALSQLDPATRSRLQITQQTREEDRGQVAAAYEGAGITADLSPFFTDMEHRLARSHLVIARAGASTVTELAVVGRPSILVPLAIAMDDHQTHNAKALSERGAAWIIPEPDFEPGALATRLESLLARPEALGQAAGMAYGLGRPDATDRLADVVARIAKPRRNAEAGALAGTGRA